MHKLFRSLPAILAAIAPAPALAREQIVNTATLGYTAGGERVTRQSNTVVIDVAQPPRVSTLEFIRPPGAPPAGGGCPLPLGAEEAARSSAVTSAASDLGLALRLAAPGENRDRDIAESATVTLATASATLTLVLRETAPNSGIFAGTLGPDCALPPDREGEWNARFAGSPDSGAAEAKLSLDPAGYVFDSGDASLVDGATVTLLDEAGRPAAVFADDHLTPYPSTVVTGEPATDAAGRRYPAVTGRYRFPWVMAGRYRLRVEAPRGYIAPSAAEREKLARHRHPNGNPFRLVTGSTGEAFDLAADQPIGADIPVDPPAAAALLLTHTASLRRAAPGDTVQYRLHLANRGSTGSGAISLSGTLPPGFTYRKGSSHGVGEPQRAGRTLIFRLPALRPGAAADVSYLAAVQPAAPIGEAVAQAIARDDAGLTSNQAAAAVRIEPLLFTDALTLVGRVSEGACGSPARHRRGVPGVRIVMEDGTFTVTDRDGLYHVEGVRPGRHVVALDEAALPRTHRPVACDDDTRAAGRATTRFVEGLGGQLLRADFQLAPTGVETRTEQALPAAIADDATAAGNRDWLAGQTPGIGWLFPALDHNPRAPSLRVVVKHLPGQHVALSIAGGPVDPLAFDGTDANAAGVAVSRWSGIPLVRGANRLEARVLAADGRVATTLTRTVWVAGPAAHAWVDPARSRLLADGLTRPRLAVRLTDAAGRPVRAGTAVPVRVDAPYRAATEVALEQARQLAGRDKADTLAQVVGDDGYAFIALDPSPQAGAVRAHLLMADGKATHSEELRAWLSAPPRAWTIVGFGSGTIGHDLLDGHSEPLAVRARAPVLDGQLALYAKGRIRGDWLLTLAYDSARHRDPDRSLLGTIDPDRYYTVYGDGTRQSYDAPTAGQLYLRLERRQAYALFGDFETAENDAILTRYVRTLHGAKAAWQGRRVRAAGFVAETDQRHRRDEIQGNGLSGPYRLSSRLLVPNSDVLAIETRDRFRPERILSTIGLARHIDYDVDSPAGTIRLRSPLLSRDPDGNPTFLVADYEVNADAGGRRVAGGRIAARTDDGRVEVGLAVIGDRTLGDGTLVGADMTARLSAATTVRAEAATGGWSGLDSGTAALFEAEHHGRGLDLLAYARRQDVAFGLGQQNAVEAGTRKLGMEGRLSLASTLSLAATAWHQGALDGPARRTAADLRLEWRRPSTTLYAGATFADDRGLDGGTRRSRLLTLGATKALLGGRLTLTGEAQAAPGGSDASVDFPVRQRLDAALRLTPAVRLLAGYERASGNQATVGTARIGFDLSPWSGASLAATVNQQAVGENGTRTFAQYGLRQSLTLGSRWSLDATLDSARTLRGSIPDGTRITLFQPVASGGVLGIDAADGDYLAATLGATYRVALWSLNGRLELRRAASGNRVGVLYNALRTLGAGGTLAGGLRFFTATDARGARSTSATGDIAFAWRPLDSRWSLLDRASLRHERAVRAPSGDPLGLAFAGGDGETTRVINNLALGWRSGEEGRPHRVEATLYYGIKYVAGRYGDDRFDGLIDTTGLSARFDVTRHVDIGAQVAAQHAWTARAWAFSAGPSLGLSPAADLWVTTGWNVSGYRDRDAGADLYTRRGPYLTMRWKFDRRSIGNAARALLGQDHP